MRLPVKYELSVQCCCMTCKQRDMAHILWTEHYLRISMPAGWRRHEPSGYCLCPDHTEYEVAYFDDDSVFIQLPARNG